MPSPRSGRWASLRLKTPWHDGTSHLLLSPHEFLEKLAAINPPPKSHLVRWGGVFAANSPLRKNIVLRPEQKKGFDFDSSAVGAIGEHKRQNKTWSLMLSRGFKAHGLKCSCGGKFVPLGALRDPAEIRRYLQHVHMDYDPPPRSPPSQAQGSFGFVYGDQDFCSDHPDADVDTEADIQHYDDDSEGSSFSDGE